MADNGNIVLRRAPKPELPMELVARLIDDVTTANAAKAKKVSEEERIRATISALLDELGGLGVQEDGFVFDGDKVIIPQQWNGNLPGFIDHLRQLHEQQQKMFETNKSFPYRPYDGAHAFMQVMRMLTGTSGLGVTQMTFFGPIPPQYISIKTGVDTSTQVPWGEVNFPMFRATFHLGYTRTEQGPCFQLSVTAPQMERRRIDAIFRLIEEHLREKSIYRGQAINGNDVEPQFIDLNLVDPDSVVYSAKVMEDLAAHLWLPIEHTDELRKQGLPVKRAVLLSGPYGCGKSLAGVLTARRAVANGWTLITCRTGIDNPADTLKTAELYAPAVVVIEDIDIHASSGSSVEISKMLEMLDGVVNKGKEIVALFTTNHIDELQRGALRPGRIDAIIEIGQLDEAAFRRLITRKLGEKYLATDIDWAEVSVAFNGYMPAFVAESAARAQFYAMARNNGQPSIISTHDLVAAADSARPQFKLMQDAREGADVVTLDGLIDERISDVLKRASWNDIPIEVEDRSILDD